MGVDYEKLVDGIGAPDGGGSAPDPATEEVISPAAQKDLNRVYLPLDHEKYQGIAEAKGYAQGDDFSGQRLQRVHYSHEAMIDVIITNPTITQGELAKQFGKSQSWISIIMGSDAFQGALAKRRDDLMNPEIVATLEERFRGLADQSLQVLAEKLESTRNTDLALKTLDISSKALGFGARAGQINNTQNNYVVALPPKIADAAEWAAQRSKPAQISNG